jgi:FKBP-type peptidyl-prolyl cis-trans isomerase 2
VLYVIIFEIIKGGKTCRQSKDRIRVHYTLKDANGKVIESSKNRPHRVYYWGRESDSGFEKELPA